jgi:hypothetical protein
VKSEDRTSPGEVSSNRRSGKYRFKLEEKYGVWIAHDRKCRLCGNLIKFRNLTIDHYFPERLQNDHEAVAQIIEEFSLPDDFEINSFANWVPAHQRHNRKKRSRVPKWTPNEQSVVEGNLARAGLAARKSERIKTDASSGRTLTQVLRAIEARTLTLIQLVELVDDLLVDPTSRGLPEGAVFLDDGRMFAGAEIVKIAICQCERDLCVGEDRKVRCVFTSDQSEWVIGAGLFHACYDELIICARCETEHKRGYVGRGGSCAAPFAQQKLQSN